MRLLLDTNALIRALTAPHTLSRTARRAIEEEAEAVFVPVVAFWEVAIKHRVGKLPLSAAEAQSGATRTGFRTLGIEPSHLRHLQRLPLNPHRDPFDHLIVAQALAESLTLVTADRDLARYGADLLLG